MKDYARQRAVAEQLRPVAGDDAFSEAGFLLAYANEHPNADLDALIARRADGEPLQYVLGEWSFMGLPFTVDRRALIPRPDTEILCEKALSLLPEGGAVLDLCCGSGCIGIALAKKGGAVVTAADISEEALSLTRENAAKNGVSIRTVRSDLFERIEGAFDMIVCNPPYLDREEMEQADASLRYEPALALYGGTDGLDFYRRIQKTYAAHLKAGGYLLLEIGYRQEQAVRALFCGAECIYDYGDRPRCTVVKKHDRKAEKTEGTL